MASLSGWITLYSFAGLENLGFNTATIRVWMHNSVNDDLTLMGERFVDLGGSPIINQHMRFLLDERMTLQQLGFLHFVIEIIPEASALGLADIGSIWLPVQGLVRSGWVMPVTSHIRSESQQYPMGLLNLCVYTELPNGPANYTHLSPPTHAPYANTVAPQLYQPPPIYGTIVSHFLGGIFGQISSQITNQDIFGDGSTLADLIATYFT